VQEEYVKPLVRLRFCDAPGCCNADGIKTDFMADKIHPNVPVYDPEWRREERFIFSTFREPRSTPPPIRAGSTGEMGLCQCGQSLRF
jgi:hypothetical protein